MDPTFSRLSTFSYLLILLFLWQAPSLFFLGGQNFAPITYAQKLTAPTISEGSVQSLSASKISLAQWQKLQSDNSQSLLEQPDTIKFLEHNFNLDGAYGEMKSGVIVNNWEALAKNMSASGLALAGAYAVWRRRRLQQLKSLRGGDGAALENLFAKSFNPPENQATSNQTKNTVTTTPLPSATPPNSYAAWKAWGERQGLFATGATLSALFLLWKKRQQSPLTSTSWEKHFRSFFDPNKRPSYQKFYKSVKISSNKQIQAAQAKAVLQFENEHPAPVAPSKTPSIENYENLANYNYRRNFLPYSQAIKEANAIRYDKNAKVDAVKKGLLKVWAQYFYFKSVGKTQAAEVMHRNAYSLANFGHRFATARQKWEISNLKAQAQAQFTRLNKDHQTYQQSVQTYRSLKNRYEERRATVLAAAAAPLKGWEASIWQWWQQATDKVNKTQAWILKLNQLRAQNTNALTHKKEQETKKFKQSLALITQVFNEKNLKALLSGQTDESILPTVTALAPADASAQLEAKLAALHKVENDPTTVELYKDEQAFLAGYRVIRGCNGKRYYYQSYYNARYNRWEQHPVQLSVAQKKAAAKQKTQVYAQKAQIIRQGIQTQMQKHQAEQLIKVIKKEKDAKFNPELHQLAQFLKSVQQDSNSALAHSVWRLLRQLNQWQTTLQQQKNTVASPNLSWTETIVLKQSIENLTAKIQSHQKQIRAYQQASISVSETEFEPVVQAGITVFKESNLKNNKIYKYLETLHTAREFYKTYGQDISVLETLKAKLKAKIDSLAPLEDVSAYTHGYEFYDYQALKADYIKLLNNQLPDVYIPNWSWYKTGYRTQRTTAVPNRNDAKLHNWYHKSLTLFNKETKLEYQAKIKTREAALFAQREAEFNQQQLVALKEIFSAKDIKTYQDLIQAEIEAQNQLSELESSKQAQENSFYDNLIEQNKTLLTAPIRPKTLAIKTLKKSDVTHITLSYQSSSNQTLTSRTQAIPPQLLEPLWQSYRRFNNEWQFDQFKQEAQRLTAQAKVQYKNGLIADAGLPPAPTQTKTVHDYLADPQRFNTDIEKQIKVVEASIPILKQKFSGQAYLSTALAQAKSKIKALKRYRTSGPTEVKQYQEDLRQWKQNHAYILTQIETGAANHFKDLETYLSGFWQQADTIAEEKAQAIAAENIIDTRDTVEKIAKSPWEYSSESPQLKTESDAFMKNLSRANVKPKDSFLLKNKAVNNQVKIYQTAQSKFLRSQGLTSSSRTNDEIEKLHPNLREDAIKFINTVEDNLAIQLVISNGFRSFEEQNNLYNQGKDDLGSIVTTAKGGESYHNYGLAFDVVEIKNEKTNYTLPWDKISKIGKELGFEWGGDWESFPDKPHFQKTFGLSVSKLQESYENNNYEEGFIKIVKPRPAFTSEEIALKHKIVADLQSNLQTEQIAFRNFDEFSEAIKQQIIEHYKGKVERAKNSFILVVGKTLRVSEKISELVSSNSELTIDLLNVGSSIWDSRPKTVKYAEALANGTITALKTNNFTVTTESKDMAALAQLVYDENNTGLDNYVRLKGEDLSEYGLNESDLYNAKTGFKSAIYKNGNKIVWALAGTDPTSWIDWWNDFRQGLGWDASQYQKVKNISDILKSKNLDKKLIITGQSLGGGLAAVAGAITGATTHTFNAAGIHENTLTKFNIQERDFQHITNHISRGDALTEMQTGLFLAPDAIGNQVYHQSKINEFIPPSVLGTLIHLRQHGNYQQLLS